MPAAAVSPEKDHGVQGFLEQTEALESLSRHPNNPAKKKADEKPLNQAAGDTVACVSFPVVFNSPSINTSASVPAEVGVSLIIPFRGRYGFM